MSGRNGALVARQPHKLEADGSIPSSVPNLVSTFADWLFPMARIVWTASETLKDDRAARGVMATTTATRMEVNN